MACSYNARGEGKYGLEPHKISVHENNIVWELRWGTYYVAQIEYVGLGILFAGSKLNLWGSRLYLSPSLILYSLLLISKIVDKKFKAHGAAYQTC